MKKIVLLILMLALAAAAFAGCGTGEGNGTDTTRTITDAAGRTVEIPATVERIVPLGTPYDYLSRAGK